MVCSECENTEVERYFARHMNCALACVHDVFLNGPDKAFATQAYNNRVRILSDDQQRNGMSYSCGLSRLAQAAGLIFRVRVVSARHSRMSPGDRTIVLALGPSFICSPQTGSLPPMTAP